MQQSELKEMVHEVINSEAINMQIAQMVKCSVSEQLRNIALYTVPLICTIVYLVVDDYKEMKQNTTTHAEVFTKEISHLREAIVELKTTIRSD